MAFNQYYNRMRRLDEASPETTRMNPAEFWHGGFSAAQSRLRRAAKSRRKASQRVTPSRHMKLS